VRLVVHTINYANGDEKNFPTKDEPIIPVVDGYARDLVSVLSHHTPKGERWSSAVLTLSCEDAPE